MIIEGETADPAAWQDWNQVLGDVLMASQHKR